MADLFTNSKVMFQVEIRHITWAVATLLALAIIGLVVYMIFSRKSSSKKKKSALMQSAAIDIIESQTGDEPMTNCAKVYYMNGCGWCSKLKAELEEASKSWTGPDMKIYLCNIALPAHNKSVNKTGLTGVPVVVKVDKLGAETVVSHGYMPASKLLPQL